MSEQLQDVAVDLSTSKLCKEVDMDTINEGVRQLVVAIIRCAVIDWDTRKAEVRAFFKSDWGRNLCEILDLSADVILEKLEKRRSVV